MDTQVAIVGSGPYGLSVAAQLGKRGIPFRVFGPLLDTWRHHMPAAMLLKSDGFASSLCAPTDGWTLGEYCVRNHIPYERGGTRVKRADFVDYASAFQRNFAPELDERMVTNVSTKDAGFALELGGGEQVSATRVVLANGITQFAYLPAQLRGLGPRVTHSGDYSEYHAFAGKKVAVIGAGSSSTMTVAGLVDAGADVTLVARSSYIPFWDAPDGQAPTLKQRLRKPETGLGPGLRNKLLEEIPDAFALLPGDFRLKVVEKHLGPVSGWWLRERVMEHATVLTDTSVVSVHATENNVQLELKDPSGVSSRTFDDVIAGTGYIADLDRLTFLSPPIRTSIARVGTMPALSHSFESSVAGLYFIGPAASGTFGPLMRFMVGAEFAAPRVAAAITRKEHGSTWSRRPSLV